MRRLRRPGVVVGMGRMLRAPWARLALAVILGFAHRRERNGVRIFASRASLDPDGEIEKIRQGLELLERVDPRRHARLRKVMPRVYVGAPRTALWDYVAVGSINRGVLASGTAATVALVLVHHSVVAKFVGRRAGGPRMSRLAVKEQLRFARKLPPGFPDRDGYVRAATERLHALPAGR